MAATYRAPGQIITSLLDTDWYKLTMMQGFITTTPMPA